MGLEHYHGGVGNWREQIKRNQRRTRGVIALFFAIYFGVGLIADAFILQATYPHITFDESLSALLHFKVIPYATLIMVGIAAVSLMITYACYDRIMLLGTEYREITPKTENSVQEQQLYNVVEEMKVAAGLGYMPRVFIIEADYMNAFASGYSEKSAMIAITRGLIEKLTRAELQAVMAHELSHIRHYDIKLTLMVAVLSNILLIVVDVLFYSVLFKQRDGNQREENRIATIILILRYVLPLMTVLLTLFLSRTREYMADAGCVELMRDNEPLARALLKISMDHKEHAEHCTEEYGRTPHEEIRQEAYLFDPTDIDPVKSFSTAFATHPSIEQRLQALGFKSKSDR